VTTTGTDTFTPRLNHVAIRVDPAMLDAPGRAEILDFYGDVFGWTEGDNTGERNDPLIMYTGTFGQFVYLARSEADAGGAAGSAVEHFGLQVATLAELEAIVTRARACAETDDRVRVSDVHARTTHGPTADYTLTSAYIGFVLPFTVELQHIARVDRA
jgi:catechol 2,3-dioxygenase-like lactoylglutathione lyase family enzyme